MNSNNTIANILFVIGIIEIVTGIILGIVLATTTYGTIGTTEFSFKTFFTFFLSGMITGMLTIGLSEVINLLDSIKKSVAPKDDDDDLELLDK